MAHGGAAGAAVVLLLAECHLGDLFTPPRPSTSPSRPAPAARLALATEPSPSAVAGVAFPQQPVVQLVDTTGSPVGEPGIAVTAALASGGGSIAGTATEPTDSSGKAAFRDLMITGAPGPRTLSFAAPGLGRVTSSAVSVAAPPPPTASPATSVVSVSSADVTSGAAATLTLQARDSTGASLTTGGATVVFTASGGTSRGTIGATADRANGTYTATFTATAAGTATTIGATINGAAVTTALPTITVTPGAVSTGRSLITVSSATVAVTGSVTLTLQAKDAFGNNLTTGGLTVVFDENGSTIGTIGGTTDHGDGTYTATFTAVTPGTATVGATINGVAVTSPQPTITVTL